MSDQKNKFKQCHAAWGNTMSKRFCRHIYVLRVSPINTEGNQIHLWVHNSLHSLWINCTWDAKINRPCFSEEGL